MDGFVKRGKASVIIDGQFGSTGKGLIAGYVGQTERIDIATTNASANAGHTMVMPDGRKLVAYHLPMSGIFDRSAILYLNAGAIINPVVLEQELDAFESFNVRSRLIIHARAAVIENQDVEAELASGSAATKIASTRHGVGAALCRKIQRSAVLAGDHPALSKWTLKSFKLNAELRQGARVVVEVPQGYGLGINSGLSYPYCTSREVSIPQALSDAAIHPSFLGDVLMTLRTYPIRVGNIRGPLPSTGVLGAEPQKEGVIGWSGPWYDGQEETSWEALGVEPEITTVTKRVRRVAHWSPGQYEDAIEAIRPTHVFLNFVNYLTGLHQLKGLVATMNMTEMAVGLQPPRRYFGVGPMASDVYGTEDLLAICCRMGWEKS